MFDLFNIADCGRFYSGFSLFSFYIACSRFTPGALMCPEPFIQLFVAVYFLIFVEYGLFAYLAPSGGGGDDLEPLRINVVLLGMGVWAKDLIVRGLALF